ncbi:MAG: DUF3370 family protein, partial [Cyanobium sp.]
PRPLRLALAVESPLKSDAPQGGLRFRGVPASPGASKGLGPGNGRANGPSSGGPVMFRGTVEVSGLDGANGRPAGRQAFHLVQRAGQEGPPLGTINLAPGAVRQVQVRLIYPADATPPQVLSLLPLGDTPSQGELGTPRAAGTGGPGAVKQSPAGPVSPNP